MLRMQMLLMPALFLGACGGAASQPSGTPASLHGALNVFAASSLTAAFTQARAQFTSAHPGLTLTINFNGSPTLVTQIEQGAPADVFASADRVTMNKLSLAGLTVGTPKDFAHNRLQIVVAAGNPKHITSLSDLQSSNLAVDLCAPAVPCGSYASTSLKEAGVHVNPKGQEQNVAGVLSKVALGEADVGIVYRTDVKAAVAAGAKVQGVDIPDAYQVVATYPISIVKGTRNRAGAQAFIDFIAGPRGQKILATAGFLPPG